MLKTVPYGDADVSAQQAVAFRRHLDKLWNEPCGWQKADILFLMLYNFDKRIRGLR